MMTTAVALIALFAAFAPAGLRADIVLDQQHSFTSATANSTNGDISQMGQTFTVGIAGTLARIDVLMFRLGGAFDPAGDPVLRIYNVASGLPTGSPIATFTIPKANVPLNAAAMVPFDVSAASLAVAPGNLLAFSISATAGSGPYFLLTDQGQSIEYTGGEGVAKFGSNPWQFFNVPQDHGFQTWVDTSSIPEPASFAGTWVLAAALLLRRRPDKSGE